MSGANRKTDKVCDICGNIGFLEDIITCYQCKKASEHMYCMQKQTFIIPDIWYCDECLPNFPLCEGKTRHLLNKRKSHSKQLISRKTSKIVKNVKVKIIPSEEVSFCPGKYCCKRAKLGASRRQSYGTNVRVPSCSQNMSTAMSTTLGLRSVLLTQLHEGSFDDEVLPSPKRSVSTEHISKKNEVRIQKNKSAGTIDSSCVPSKGPVLQQMDLPATLIMWPSEKLPSRPATETCWKGYFEFVEVVNQIFGGMQAHFPQQVLPKVYEVSKQLPQKLKLKIIPRHDAWPKIFKLDPPNYADIGIYFSCKVDRFKEKFIRFLERISSRDCAMQTYIGNTRLLIYSSKVLPADSQCLDGQIYLWGLFQRFKRKSQHKQEQSPPCDPSINMKFNNCSKSSASFQGKSEEVDMEIDMLGGREIGRVDKPIQRLDGPPGFAKGALPGLSKPISSDVNHEKQSMIRFSLEKKLPKAIHPEVPPGFFETPTLKQEHSLPAKFISQNLYALENNNLSVKSGGYFVGAAPKASEMQPKDSQATGHLNKPVNFTGGLCPLVEKKRGITSNKEVLQDTNLPMISMKSPSISAKGNTCSSNSLFPEKQIELGESASLFTPLSQKKQERESSRATNHAGCRELSETETVVHSLCADLTPKGGNMRGWRSSDRQSNESSRRISQVGKAELSYEKNGMENRMTGKFDRLVDKGTKLKGQNINQGTVDEVQVSKIIVPDKMNSKEDEGRYKVSHHGTPSLMDKQLSLVSAHYDPPSPSPDLSQSITEERTKIVGNSKIMISKERNANKCEGTHDMRRQRKQLSLVSCCYESDDSPFSSPEQALQSAGTVALPLFPEVDAKGHGIEINTERQDISSELSLSRPQYVKNGNAWVPTTLKEVLEQDGCEADLHLKL